MLIAAFANLADDIAEPVGDEKVVGVSRTAVGLQHDAHLADDVEQRAGAGRQVGLQIVDISDGASAAGHVEIDRQQLRALGTVIGKRQRDAIGSGGLVPDLAIAAVRR